MIPTVDASGAPRTAADRAALAPVRNEVMVAQSMTATSSPVAAADSSKAPVTTGRPRAELPGNDVTHLSDAKPSPRAGIARKSPFGGESRYTFGGISHSPRAYRSNAKRTRSIARDGPTAALTASPSRTGTFRTAPRLESHTMSRNGERRPPRPKIRLLTDAASEGEAAAVVAAIEQFLADTSPAPSPEAAPAASRWQRAALLEGVSRAQLLAWGSDSG